MFSPAGAQEVYTTGEPLAMESLIHHHRVDTEQRSMRIVVTHGLVVQLVFDCQCAID
ncbi:hypothetical protein C6341_g27401, partial [Phytophthora cactorum]